MQNRAITRLGLVIVFDVIALWIIGVIASCSLGPLDPPLDNTQTLFWVLSTETGALAVESAASVPSPDLIKVAMVQLLRSVSVRRLELPPLRSAALGCDIDESYELRLIGELQSAAPLRPALADPTIWPSEVEFRRFLRCAEATPYTEWSRTGLVLLIIQLLLLGAMAVGLWLMVTAAVVLSRHSMTASRMIRCPHCRATLVRLQTRCNECGFSVDEWPEHLRG